MEKRIKFFWTAGFFLPAINATVFTYVIVWFVLKLEKGGKSNNRRKIVVDLENYHLTSKNGYSNFTNVTLLK